jgi:hypothetical protein
MHFQVTSSVMQIPMKCRHTHSLVAFQGHLVSHATEMDSQAGCIFRSPCQSCNRDILTSWIYFQATSSVMQQRQTHSLDAFSGHLVSHATSDKSQNTNGLTPWMHFQLALSVMQQRQTHKLNAFSGCLISHTTSDETQRQTHTLDAFSGHLISHATETDSLAVCIFRSPHQSCNRDGLTC